jgi:uncharacterized membrane protein YeaQ/YmgE (transglycosylase-associated protein family)
MEYYQLIVGIIFLICGFFSGNLLAKATKEELKSGKKWFKLLIIISLIGAVVFLFIKKDAILFAFLFMAVVTSRSLKR